MENIIIGNREYEPLDVVVTRNSAGRLNKLWIQDKLTGEQYLIKGSTFMALEPYSEVMAYRIGQYLGLNVLEYWLLDAKYFKGFIANNTCRHVSVCRKIENNVLSIVQIKNTIKSMNPNITNNSIMERVMTKSQIDEMLFFDAIIGNKDRHYRNVHVVRDDQGNTLSAPLLDNGDSLLATEVLSGLTGLISLDKSATIARTHTKQLEYITTINTDHRQIQKVTMDILRIIEDVMGCLVPTRRKALQIYIAYRISLVYKKLDKSLLV